MYAPLIGLALAILAPSVPAPSSSPLAQSRIASWVRSTENQRVSIWTDHDDSPYRRGDRARVYFQAQTDGYITVLRVDTDGRIRVLFPREPWEDNFARGGRSFEVLDRNDNAFSVDDYPGVGYIFAISSPDQFQYDDFIRGDHWDYQLIADGRVRGDPYVSLTDFASRIAGPGEYDYDITPYYVDQHYDYPRFLCYDCHSYVSYSYWNPYYYNCNRFRIVIYDDSYYYPYRYYNSRNVVIVRPYRPGPRYVFKDYNGRGDYITRERQRPSDEGRRIAERDRTSADVGGRGSIPAPVDPRRRVTGNSGSGSPTGQPDNGQSNPRRRTGETGPTTDQPGNPSQPEPRRRSDDNPATRPNVQPPAQPNSDPSGGRRQQPDRKPDLRETDTQRPPDRRGTDDHPTQEPNRRADPGNDPGSRTAVQPRVEPRNQPSQEPRRTQPSTEPRAEPRRSEPPRTEPTRTQPPPRVESPPPSRGQPTGEPSLRRRRPD